MPKAASSTGHRLHPRIASSSKPVASIQAGTITIRNTRLLTSAPGHEFPLYDVTCSHETGLITSIEPAFFFSGNLWAKPENLPTLFDKTDIRRPDHEGDTEISAEGSWLMPGSVPTSVCA